MAIRVEFYGVARLRAGVSELAIDAPAKGLPLSGLMHEVGCRFPRFASECLVDGRLHRALAANLDGNEFISDPSTPIRDGQCVMILSADAGG